ncbi:MAG: PaaI family thioesterase [Rhizobiaceae bacterium]
MTNKAFDIPQLKALLGDVFAPMIQNMAIEPVAVTSNGATFEIPENADIVRGGGIVCGQAVASIADTVGVLALYAHNAPPREMTTVDMTTHFMRPLMSGTLDVDAIIVSNGRRMATVRVEVRQRGKEKVAATTTCAYVYL